MKKTNAQKWLLLTFLFFAQTYYACGKRIAYVEIVYSELYLNTVFSCLPYMYDRGLLPSDTLKCNKKKSIKRFLKNFAKQEKENSIEWLTIGFDTNDKECFIKKREFSPKDIKHVRQEYPMCKYMLESPGIDIRYKIIVHYKHKTKTNVIYGGVHYLFDGTNVYSISNKMRLIIMELSSGKLHFYR